MGDGEWGSKMGLLDSDVDTKFVFLGTFGGRTPVADGNARTPFEKAHQGVLPEEITLEEVASLLVASWDNPSPAQRGGDYARAHTRLSNYVRSAALPVVREEIIRHTPPSLLGGVKPREIEGKQYFVRSADVGKCLVQQKDPLLGAQGLVAWLSQHGVETQTQTNNGEQVVGGVPEIKDTKPEIRRSDALAFAQKIRNKGIDPMQLQCSRDSFSDVLAHEYPSFNRVSPSTFEKDIRGILGCAKRRGKRVHRDSRDVEFWEKAGFDLQAIQNRPAIKPSELSMKTA